MYEPREVVSTPAEIREVLVDQGKLSVSAADMQSGVEQNEIDSLY